MNKPEEAKNTLRNIIRLQTKMEKATSLEKLLIQDIRNLPFGERRKISELRRRWDDSTDEKKEQLLTEELNDKIADPEFDPWTLILECYVILKRQAIDNERTLQKKYQT